MAHAVGPRMPYEAMPAGVRAWVDRTLGSGVVSADTQYGGFSPGVAARLVTASGRRAFVKAVGPELNPDSPGLFRRELAAMQALAAEKLPQAPMLYDGYDDGGWVALLLEDIEGRMPDQPWNVADAGRVLRATAELTERLTPSPWPDAPLAAERSESFLSRWELVPADGTPVPDWIGDRVPELAELAATGRQALAADEALAHWDIRSDNVLLTDERVVFVDWAHPARAAAWADLVIVSADIRGSLTGAELAGLPAPPDGDAVTGFLAAVAGGLWWAAHQPDPPGLPTLREWQREHAEVHLAWLRERL